MTIYTKTGDSGSTGLFSGERVAKTDARVDAYGTVDELNANLGVLRSLLPESCRERDMELRDVQHILFHAGSLLATSPGSDAAALLPPFPVGSEAALERAIDVMTEVLPRLTGFVLPGGTPAASTAHVARTVCRRAERRIVATAEAGQPSPGFDALLVFINRLSDYLFTLARFLNAVGGVGDTLRDTPQPGTAPVTS